MENLKEANMKSAVGYVLSHGSPLEIARLRCIEQEETPLPGLYAFIKDAQREDGGWAPPWARDYSSLDATCYYLAQIEQLGLAGEPMVERSLHFLISRQNPDGSFSEDSSVSFLAPPWAKPGDPAATLYLTANCGYWLSFLTREEDGRIIKSPVFIKGHLSEDGKLPSFLHTHWLAAPLLHRHGCEEDARRIAGYLAGRLAGMAASNLAWMLNAFLTAAFPVTPEFISKAFSRLSLLQQSDGRWPGEDGPAFDVHTTLEVIRAYRGYAQGSPAR